MYRDYYRLLLVDQSEEKVLMVKEGAVWDLPCFEHMPCTSRNLIRSVEMLQTELGLDLEEHLLTPIFPIVTHLVDRGRGCGHLKWQQDRLGYTHLLLMDCHLDLATMRLPKNYAWQTAEFVKKISVPDKYDECIELILKTTVQVLEKDELIKKMLWRPQHKAGWFMEASQWLVECVRRDGAEVSGRAAILRVTGMSTSMSVSSSKGHYFLKAPSTENNEMVKTRTISKLFPNLSLDLVGFHEVLGSFASRQVRTDVRDVSREMSCLALKTLLQLQHGSLRVMDALKSGGVPTITPDDLVVAFEKWLSSPKLIEKGGKYLMTKIAPAFFPKLQKYVEDFKRFKIPLTLIHGDFARRNFGFKSCAANEESGILFDWDRSIISHPFFDLHAYKHVDNNALQAALDDYLRQWTKYESLERVRQCFEMSHIFGFLLCAYHAATQIEAGAMDSINMFAPYFGSNVSVAVTLFEKMNESLVPTSSCTS